MLIIFSRSLAAEHLLPPVLVCPFKRIIVAIIAVDSETHKLTNSTQSGHFVRRPSKAGTQIIISGALRVGDRAMGVLASERASCSLINGRH